MEGCVINCNCKGFGRCTNKMKIEEENGKIMIEFEYDEKTRTKMYPSKRDLIILKEKLEEILKKENV